MVSERLRKVFLEVATRGVACAIVLIFGVSGMFFLAGMKKPPAEAEYKERPLRVEAVRAELEDLPVSINGYGEVRALNTVSIAPEVSGRIVEVHPRLEVGEVVPEGEILFKIDSRDHQARCSEARATVEQWKNSISRLERQYAIDRERLKTLERNRDLAEAEFVRVKRLLERDSVGTASGVEMAEQNYNRALDLAAQLAAAVELYPIRILEAGNALTAATARMAKAGADLDRCMVESPFDARLKQVSLEVGQYVAPGMSVLTLADDSVLEIQVPLDSRDARQWLLFNGERTAEKTAWFSRLDPVTCKIRWTGERDNHFWEGRLHRVVEFDQETRTLAVAIRVEAREDSSEDPNELPLVEGMFCSVEIPGRTVRNVIRLPRWSVSFENTVHVALDNRLVTAPVEVARVEGEHVYVSAGLAPGDTVITTRLIDPLEGSLLELTLSEEESPPPPTLTSGASSEDGAEGES